MFFRQGRMKTGDWSKNFDQNESTDDLKGAENVVAARAWMEIVPDNNDLQFGPLQVGEPAILSVKSTLPGENHFPTLFLSQIQLPTNLHTLTTNDTHKQANTKTISYLFPNNFPEEIGWRVVDCTAHDGLGDSSQKLLDEDGCPMDESLLPVPLMSSGSQRKFMRHQEAVSRFSAFKFPDRDRLHVSCGMILCRGPCLEVSR